MATRINAPNQFEALSPPWILSQLDTNFTQNQAAWNDSSLGFMNGLPTDTGSANAYLITLPLGVPSSYRAGMCVSFIPANTNTASSIITVSPLGSTAIVNPAGIALNGGEISANSKLDLIHDGTSFRIIGPCLFNNNLGTVGTNQSVECAGYTGINVIIQLSASITLTLNHLSQGVPVIITATNSSGSTKNLTVAANGPASGPLIVNHVPTSNPLSAGAFTAVGLGTGGTFSWTGSNVGGTMYLFGS